MRVEFTLSMPGVGSWDGIWSGEDRHHAVTRKLSKMKIKELGIPNSWYYDWADGWCARVTARVMGKGERRRRSDGFCGYSWMVDNIIQFGSPRVPEEDK